MSRANYSPPRGNRQLGETRPHGSHCSNPPGSKLLRRFYKAKHGVRGSAQKAATWYAIRNPKEPAVKVGHRIRTKP